MIKNRKVRKFTKEDIISTDTMYGTYEKDNVISMEIARRLNEFKQRLFGIGLAKEIKNKTKK